MKEYHAEVQPGRRMKDTKDVTAVVFDHGMFMPLAVRLAKEFKQVYYHTPCEKGFPDVKEWVLGDGSSVIHRCDYPLDTSFLQEVDLFVFPDIQHGRLQRYLEDMGFPVWGSRRADELESMKGVWYRKLKELGLKVPKHEVVKGLDNLRSVLMDRDNLYIKINRYRKTMDTWHHIDWAQSRLIVDDLAKKLGPMQDFINFYVLDPIDTDLEGGLDTFCIDGQWPKDVVMGYECKNKAYLATVLPFKEAPEEFRFANEAIADTLKEYRYRNFFSTEVRVSGEHKYFIDPTLRLASPAGECELDLYTNLGDIVWHGANGDLVDPVIHAPFAGESFINHTGDQKEWRALRVPESVKENVKLYANVEIDGVNYFPPGDEETLGAITATGETLEEVISTIGEVSEELKENAIEVDMAPFAELLKEIRSAEDEGIEFSEQEVPKPEVVVKGS